MRSGQGQALFAINADPCWIAYPGHLQQVRLNLLCNSPATQTLVFPVPVNEVPRNEILHLPDFARTVNLLLLPDCKVIHCPCNGHGFCGLGRISRCRVVMWSAHRAAGAFCFSVVVRAVPVRPVGVNTRVSVWCRAAGFYDKLSCSISVARPACCLGVFAHWTAAT